MPRLPRQCTRVDPTHPRRLPFPPLPLHLHSPFFLPQPHHLISSNSPSHTNPPHRSPTHSKPPRSPPIRSVHRSHSRVPLRVSTTRRRCTRHTHPPARSSSQPDHCVAAAPRGRGQAPAAAPRVPSSRWLDGGYPRALSGGAFPRAASTTRCCGVDGRTCAPRE